MQKFAIFASLTAFFFLFTPATRGQDASEVERLRKDNELLKRESELLKREIELLKREIELFKKQSPAIPGAAKEPETEGKQARRKAMMRDATGHVSVEVELVKCARSEGSKLVTFTFAARWIDGRSKGEAVSLGRLGQLKLFAADGERMDGKTLGGPKQGVSLSKGETTKFQRSFLGVDPDIKQIDEVRVGWQFGVDELHFYRIKIETDNKSEIGESEKGGSKQGGTKRAKKGDR